MAQSSPRLPKTIACTLVAVPHSCGNAVLSAVDDGPVVVPAVEHGPDGAPELIHRVVRELATLLLLHDRLELGDDLLELIGGQFVVVLDAGGLAGFVDDGFERVFVLLVAVDAQHDVAVHLHEAAIAVPGEALVAGLGLMRAATVFSFRPMFRTVSIMPGMDSRAPERQESSSGFVSQPNLAPIVSSILPRAFSTSSFTPAGYSPFVLGVMDADVGGDGEPGGDGQAVLWPSPRGWRPSRPGCSSWCDRRRPTDRRRNKRAAGPSGAGRLLRVRLCCERRAANAARIRRGEGLIRPGAAVAAGGAEPYRGRVRPATGPSRRGGW